MPDVDEEELPDEQKAFLSLVRIIAVLMARSGQMAIDITEAELMELPKLPALTTFKNPGSFTHHVEIDLPPATVVAIQQAWERHQSTAVAYVADPETGGWRQIGVLSGLQIAGRVDVEPVVGRERVVNRDAEEQV